MKRLILIAQLTETQNDPNWGGNGNIGVYGPEQRPAPAKQVLRLISCCCSTFHVTLAIETDLTQQDKAADAFADLSEPVIEFLKKGCHFSLERFRDADAS